MVATVMGGEGVGGERGVWGCADRCCHFSLRTLQPQPETSYNVINLVPPGKIWQLSEFYMKTLPLLTIFSPVSQHPSDGWVWDEDKCVVVWWGWGFFLNTIHKNVYISEAERQVFKMTKRKSKETPQNNRTEEATGRQSGERRSDHYWIWSTSPFVKHV